MKSAFTHWANLEAARDVYLQGNPFNPDIDTYCRFAHTCFRRLIFSNFHLKAVDIAILLNMFH